MNGVNLIPARYREAQLRRLHLRRCAVGCVVYIILLSGGYAAARGAWGRIDPGPPQELEAATVDVRQAELDVATVRAQLLVAQANLQSARSICEQPDWSVLLALLAAALGDEVVLESCQLKIADPPKPPPPVPGAPPASQPAVEPPTVLILTMTGLGRSQPAVAQFVIRLEQTRLFERVALIGTNRRPFLESEAVSFKLECSMQEAAGVVR